VKNFASKIHFLRWVAKPFLKPLAEAFGKGGECPLIRLSGAKLESARLSSGEDTGDGEGFFRLSVVEVGGQVGISEANLVEEPGVKLGGEVGGSMEVGVRFQGESDAEQSGVG